MSNQLFIPFKKTTTIPIRQAVRSYIQLNHTDTHPEAFKWDIKRWEQLRKDATDESVHTSKVLAYVNYNAQLTFLLTKFPPDIGLDISYSSAFSAESDCVTLRNLLFERASMLFNLAALHSQLAFNEDRSHADGIKRASAFYQQAAGILSYLISSALPPLRQSLGSSTPDLSKPILRSLESLMLAQAQECAWQRAVMVHYKNGVIAKLAAKVASFYRDSLRTVQEAATEDAFPTTWLEHIDTKHHHFCSAAQYRKSMDDLESNKHGYELARLLESRQIAKKGLEIARCGYVSNSVLDDIKSLIDVLDKSISRAERDNDLIYHQDIPNISALPVIQEVSMVESTVPTDLQDPKSVIKDESVIFNDLVGWGAKVAIDIYRDRVGSWLRDELESRIYELNDSAEELLQDLGLPAAIEALEKPVVPPSLLKKAEEVRLEDGPSRIDGSLENADYFATRCREILDQTMDILDQEASEDEGIRKDAANAGKSLDRLPSYEANSELTRRERRYRQMLDRAAQSDRTVRNKWEQWEDAITRLTWDEQDLERWVPSTAVDRSKDLPKSRTQTHARVLRVHLEKLDGIRASRLQLAQRARRLFESDNIQQRIMREAATVDRWVEIKPAMFENTVEEETAKYEKFKAGIEDSADEQNQLLEMIKVSYGQFVESRRDDPQVKLRERSLQSLDLAYHKYREIMRNLEEGLKFYNDLSKILVQFREACKQWVRVRQDELRLLTVNLSNLRLEDGCDGPRALDSGSAPAHKVHVTLPPPDSEEWEETPVFTPRRTTNDVSFSDWDLKQDR